MTPTEKFEKWWENEHQQTHSEVCTCQKCEEERNGKSTALKSWLEQQRVIDRLREGIKELPTAQIEECMRIMRENNFVIDNLDDRWQKLCFTFYNYVIKLQTAIDELKKLLEEVKDEKEENL